MLSVGVHPVAYEMKRLPGRIAQHSLLVTLSAYKPLQRPAGSVFNQHDPRTSSSVTSTAAAAAAAGGVVISDTFTEEQIALLVYKEKQDT